MARVVITGGTGTIGRELCRALIARGDQPVVLTRDAARAAECLPAGAEFEVWARPQSTEPPPAALFGAAAVVNLAGETVAQRWTRSSRRRIWESRVSVTEMLVAGLRRLAPEVRPAVLVSQSATGYYGHADERLLDEFAPAGADFLARLCVSWESAAGAAGDVTRVVYTRTGAVLSAAADGALARMLPFYRFGLGGPIAGGRQYVPWIVIDDVVAGMLYCVDHPELSGPMNLTAPAPVTATELATTLGRVLHRPALLPIPGIAVRVLYGDMAQVVIDGQRAIPRRLLLAGFRFRRTDLAGALHELLG